eukprot:CAMPEP_0170998984 /NCGR_PEP_ID=MMETSP0736-20130129/13802_1 /TAXON_ID=186038 /ORGANISM="Fragilariopsis kerguelensis, Strain L26-C5" /LENGTH=39 /DNA_ID= /DNA_START= /DNA_END= /DNA_ORIENTATION=
MTVALARIFTKEIVAVDTIPGSVSVSGSGSGGSGSGSGS